MKLPKTKSPTQTKRKYTTSEASIQASRTNGAKSRGPRDPAARRAGALNAVTHGCTAETDVLPGESQSEFDELITSYIELLQARTVIERRYAREAGRADWRLRREARADTAMLHQQIVAAESRRLRGQDKEVARLAALLPENPGEALAELRLMSYGCSYLIDEWELLARAAAKQVALWPSQRTRAIQLSGKRECDLFTCDEVMQWYFIYLGTVVFTLGGVPAEDAANLLRDHAPAHMPADEFMARVRARITHLPTPEQAMAMLGHRVEAAIAGLKARREVLLRLEALGHDLDLRAAETNSTVAGGRQTRREQWLQKRMDQMIENATEMRQARLAGVFDPEEEPDDATDPEGPAAEPGSPGKPEADSGPAGANDQIEPELGVSTEAQSAAAETVTAILEAPGEPEWKQVPEGSGVGVEASGTDEAELPAGGWRPPVAVDWDDPVARLLAVYPLPPPDPRPLWRPEEPLLETEAPEAAAASEAAPEASEGPSAAVPAPEPAPDPKPDPKPARNPGDPFGPASHPYRPPPGDPRRGPGPIDPRHVRPPPRGQPP